MASEHMAAAERQGIGTNRSYRIRRRRQSRSSLPCRLLQLVGYELRSLLRSSSYRRIIALVASLGLLVWLLEILLPTADPDRLRPAPRPEDNKVESSFGNLTSGPQ